MTIVDKLKETLQLSNIISEHVKLRKRGVNFYGLCPFHQEKTPSFSVNDQKKIYYCFGCGAHGDIFEFIMSTKNLNFPEATKYLAQIAGINIEKPETIKDKIYKTNKIAREWFHAQLCNNSTAQKYLKERQITEETYNKIKLGYSPKQGGLLRHLKNLGIKLDYIKQAGLINNKNIEIFYNRIMFPITDDFNNIIAFGARTIDDNKTPKYLNSPESIIFKKRESLYSIQLTKKPQEIIVVEGYTDVIMLHQHNITNVLASLGTNMTTTQIHKVLKITNKITFCFDGDAAGYNAAMRLIQNILPIIALNHIIRFCFLPNNLDPDQAILSMGKTKFNSIIKNATLLSNLITEACLENLDLKIAENRCQAEQKMQMYLNMIKDPQIKKHFRYSFNRKLYSKKTHNKHNAKQVKIAVNDEDVLFGIILKYPEILYNPIRQEQFAMFECQKYHDLQNKLLDIINSQDKNKSENMLEHVNLEEVKALQNKTTIYMPNNLKDAVEIWGKIMRKIEIHTLEIEYINALNQMIKEGADNAENVQNLLKIIRELKQT